MAEERTPAWRRLDHDDRRTQILDSARKVFVDKPYDAISTEDLAKAAGVTRGLLYHYFPNKRALYLELIRELTDELAPVLKVDPTLPRDELFARNADAYLDFAERNREAWLGALRGGVGRDPEVEAILDEARENVVDRILLNQTGSPDAPEEARFLVRSFLGLAETATREWLEHGRADRDQVHALMVAALRGMLAGAVRPI